MAKTKEQIAAEEAAQKQAADEAAAKEQQQNFLSSIWDKISGFFSFGSIIMMLIVAIAGFYICQSEWGQKLIEGLADKLPGWAEKISPGFGKTVQGWMDKLGVAMGAKGALGKTLENMTAEEARAALGNNGKDSVPLAVLNVLTKTPDDWKDFIRITKEANGGTLTTPDQLKNEASIVALIQKKPQMVLALAKALTPTPGKAQTPEEQKSFTDFLVTARAIVNGPGLKTLLNKDNCANTLALLDGLKPDLKMDAKTGAALTLNAATLQKFGLLDAVNAPTTKLQTILNSMLTPKADGSMPKADEIIAAHFDMNAIEKDPVLKKLALEQSRPMIAVKVGKENVDNFTTIFGLERMAVLNSKTPAEQMTYLTNKENIAATRLFATRVADLSTLPENIRPQIEQLRKIPLEPLQAIADSGKSIAQLQAVFIPPENAEKPSDPKVPFDAVYAVKQLLAPTNRQLLQGAGYDNVAAVIKALVPAKEAAFLTGPNLKALCEAEQTLSGATYLKDHRAEALQIISALVRYETNTDPDAIQRVKPEHIAALFSEHATKEAIRQLLAGLQLTGEDGAKKDVVKTYWGATDDKGLNAVIGDKDGAAFIQEQISGKTPRLNWLPATDNFKLTWGIGGKVGENSETLIAYKKAMDAASNATTKASPSR